MPISQNVQLGTISTLANLSGFADAGRFAERNREILRRQNRQRAEAEGRLAQRMNEWIQQERQRRENTRSRLRRNLIGAIDSAQEQYQRNIQSIQQQQAGRLPNRGVYAGLSTYDQENTP